jgi:hypothetical protein
VTAPIARTDAGTYVLTLPDHHREVLGSLLAQLRDAISHDAKGDAMRRLFPVAYHADAERDAEWQRLMHDELVASRLAAIGEAAAALERAAEPGAQLSESDLDALARSVNAVRLVLGTALDVCEGETDDDGDDEGDGDAADGRGRDGEEDASREQRVLYAFLGWLLEWTVMAREDAVGS